MKRLHVLAVLCLGFFLPFILAGFPSVVINGEQSISGAVNIPSMVKKTTADLNLYVRTTGDDSHDCLSAGAACLTIQEAVNRIPKQISHTVLVDIGEGTFTYLTVAGFNIVAGSLTIQGTLNNPTLTTGTTSGTADGGSTTQCVDSGQTWTADELIGKLILVDGEYRVPYDNDGTTIDFQYPLAATCNGKAYEIVEQKTILTGTEPLIGYGPVLVTNNYTWQWHIYIKNFKVSGSTIAFYIAHNQGVSVEQCFSSGAAYYGYMSQACIGYSRWYNCYVVNAAFSGFVGSRDSVRDKIYGCVANNSAMGFYYGLMTGWLEMRYNVAVNGSVGVFLESCWSVFIMDSFIDGNSGFGVQTYSSKGGGNLGSAGRVIIDQTTISNNTSGGVSVGKGTFFQCDDLIGAGNGNYGVEVFSGSHMVITSDTTITGTSGDATINDGTTTLTWATDFNDNGDIVVNLDNGCRIERRD